MSELSEASEAIAEDCVNACDSIVTMDSDQRRACREEIGKALDRLLARAACDGLGEGSDQFLKQLLREARVHWYHDLSIPSAAALELKLIVDAAIDAAREWQS